MKTPTTREIHIMVPIKNDNSSISKCQGVSTGKATTLTSTRSSKNSMQAKTLTRAEEQVIEDNVEALERFFFEQEYHGDKDRFEAAFECWLSDMTEHNYQGLLAIIAEINY